MSNYRALLVGEEPEQESGLTEGDDAVRQATA